MALPEDLIRKMVAEAVGTFLLMIAGTGAILAGGSYALGFGFGLIAIVYAIGSISGAHVNPAVTLGLAVVGRFPMIQVPYYWLSQVLGALLASLLLRLIHGNIGNLGATQVASGYSLFDGFMMELVATAIFLFVIIAVATDKRVHPATPGLAIGATLLVIQIFAGGVSGGSVNPARSLAPALISGSFKDLWIYLTAPFIGAVIGVIAFEFIRGEDGGMHVATNLRRAVGSAQGAGTRSQPRRQAPPPSHPTDEFDEIGAPTQPRRQARPAPQQPAPRPPVDAYEYDDVPRQPQQPRPRPANYDPDAPQPQRPPQQRRRPPQQ